MGRQGLISSSLYNIKEQYMAINFPSSPVVGQTYDFGDYTYTFDGIKWTSVIKYSKDSVKSHTTISEMISDTEISNNDWIKVIDGESEYTIGLTGDIELDNGLFATEVGLNNLEKLQSIALKNSVDVSLITNLSTGVLDTVQYFYDVTTGVTYYSPKVLSGALTDIGTDTNGIRVFTVDAITYEVFDDNRTHIIKDAESYAAYGYAGGDLSKVSVMYKGLVVDSFDYLVYPNTYSIYSTFNVTGVISGDFDTSTSFDSGLDNPLTRLNEPVNNDSLVGSIQTFATESLVIGYLKCDGAKVSKSLYTKLFLRVGSVFTEEWTSGDIILVGDIRKSISDGVIYEATTTGTTSGSDVTSDTGVNWIESDYFQVPDLRGEFIRFFDDGRGVDTARVFGSRQADEFKSHTHNQRFDPWPISNGGSYDTGEGRFTSTTNSGDATTATGGIETRPRNVALSAFIKY
jgi:hypothetical protein